MNILRLQNLLKNFSDEQLSSEMQTPTGNVPQFLVLTELQRRKEMRSDFAAAQAEQPQTTVAEDMMMEESAPGSPPPMGSPSVGGPPMAGLGALSQMPQQQPARMFTGGLVQSMASRPYQDRASGRRDSMPPPGHGDTRPDRPNFYDVVGEAHEELGQARDVLGRANHEVGLAMKSIAPPQQARPGFGGGFPGKGGPRFDPIFDPIKAQSNQVNAQQGVQQLFDEGGVVKAQMGAYTDLGAMQALSRIYNNRRRLGQVPPTPMMTTEDLIAQESELGLRPQAEKQKNLINLLGLGTPGEFVSEFEQSKTVGDGTEVSDEVVAASDVAPTIPAMNLALADGTPAARDPTQPLGVPPIPTFSQRADEASQDQHTIAKADTVKRADSITDRVFAAGGDYPYQVTNRPLQGFTGGAQALQDVRSTVGGLGDLLSGAAAKARDALTPGAPSQEAGTPLPIFKAHQAVQRYKDQIEAIGGPVRTGFFGDPLESADAEASRPSLLDSAFPPSTEKGAALQAKLLAEVRGSGDVPPAYGGDPERMANIMAEMAASPDYSVESFDATAGLDEEAAPSGTREDIIRATMADITNANMPGGPNSEFAELQAQLAENPEGSPLSQQAPAMAAASPPANTSQAVKRAVKNVAARPQSNAATTARAMQAAALDLVAPPGGERLLAQASTTPRPAALRSGVTIDNLAAERNALMGAGKTTPAPPQAAAAKPKTLVEQYKDLMADYTAKNKNERISNALLGASAAMLGSQSPNFGQALGAGIAGGRAADAQFQKQTADQQKAMMNMVAKQAELDIASRRADTEAMTAEGRIKSWEAQSQHWKDTIGQKEADRRQKKAELASLDAFRKAQAGALGKKTGQQGMLQDIIGYLSESDSAAMLGKTNADGDWIPNPSTIDLIFNTMGKASTNRGQMRAADVSAVTKRYNELAVTAIPNTTPDIGSDEAGWFEVVIDEVTGEPKRGAKLGDGDDDKAKAKAIKSVPAARAAWAAWRTKRDQSLSSAAPKDLGSVGNIAGAFKKDPDGNIIRTD
jgi:hypothetical protein